MFIKKKFLLILSRLSFLLLKKKIKYFQEIEKLYIITPFKKKHGEDAWLH